MKIESRGVIYEATVQPANRRIAFFPSLCGLRSGAVMAAFQVGTAKHSPDSSICLTRSLDGGSSWAEMTTNLSSTLSDIPGSLSGPTLAELEDGRLLLLATWFDRSDPSRPLFDPVTEGILHSKLLLAESTDGGFHWSKWRQLPTPGLSGCATTGPWVQCPEAGPFVAAFESFKEYDDPRPARHAAWVVASSDGGKNFSAPLLVARHPEDRLYYWDQRLARGTKPGELVALFWTHDLAQKRDLTVHRRWLTLRPEGLELEPIEDTGIPGQIAAPLWLDDGRLLAFVVDRDRPGTMTIWVSFDRGQTWPANQRLVVHVHDERAQLSQGKEDIDFRQYWEDMGKWSFGHPALLALTPSTVLAIYYAGTPEAMSVHWARIDCSMPLAATKE